MPDPKRNPTMRALNASGDADAMVLKTRSSGEEDEQVKQRQEYWLEVALEDSFPCSDPISSMRID
jgi:hypothetical protein